MQLRLILCLFVMGYALPGYTQARTPPKQHIPYLKLIEAYTQRTVPGMRQSKPITNTHFIVIWEGAKYPENFYWQGDSTLQPCNVVKAHKIIKKSAGMPQGMDYSAQNIAPGNIHRGDTLELTPVPRGQSATPTGIPKNKSNTLFFKTGNSKWLAFSVSRLAKKHDILMP